MVGAHLVVAVGDEHHRPTAGEAATDVAQNVESGVVGPVDVLDHDEGPGSVPPNLVEERLPQLDRVAARGHDVREPLR
jgi:hypothetical protein